MKQNSHHQMQSVAMNFTIDGDPVWFNGITGTVKGLQNWSSSNVNLPDGEDSVTKENGYTEQANIITPFNRHQKFWIVTPDGREKEISDPKLHCREGDYVSLIWGNDKDRKNWNYLVFKNHTTKETYFLENVFCTKKPSKMTIHQISIVFLFIVIFITISALIAVNTYSHSLYSRGIFPFLIILGIISLMNLIRIYIKNLENINLNRKKYLFLIDYLLANKDFMQSIS
ncbi:hypothetical protein [Acetobacter sp.]|uniref:hypothetical protein n=1 Tax=Acetobacter sp. TaxID=440 RepID=UPI0039EAF24F